MAKTDKPHPMGFRGKCACVFKIMILKTITILLDNVVCLGCVPLRRISQRLKKEIKIVRKFPHTPCFSEMLEHS